MTGNLLGANTDVDRDQRHQGAESEDGRAGEQASDVPRELASRSSVASSVVLRDDRGGGS